MDNINPTHYKSHPSGVECIEVTEHLGFCLGNALKYLWRHSMKNGTEDLEKAVWYLERELANRNGHRSIFAPLVRWLSKVLGFTSHFGVDAPVVVGERLNRWWLAEPESRVRDAVRKIWHSIMTGEAEYLEEAVLLVREEIANETH